MMFLGGRDDVNNHDAERGIRSRCKLCKLLKACSA
jgi:hypothetical protein